MLDTKPTRSVRTEPPRDAQPSVPRQVTHRDLRLLHAVADGRVECSASLQPDFFVDGLACCDHLAARALVRAGLIRAVGPGARGRLLVALTAAGRDALARLT